MWLPPAASQLGHPRSFPAAHGAGGDVLVPTRVGGLQGMGPQLTQHRAGWWHQQGETP